MGKGMRSAASEHRGRRVSRKKKVVISTVAMVGLGGAAFAYWTTTGAGTGAADTGDVQAVKVNQTSVVTGLAPGSGTQPLSGNFDNPNSGPAYVTAITGTVTEVNDALGDTITGCDADDYTIAGTGLVGADVPAGNAVGSWGNLTIAFNNTGANQDVCKNAQVVISYTSS
jgi:hypothetical protein